MMVFCQSHACKLRIVFDDGTERTLYFATRSEKKDARAFYEGHGFKCK